MDLIIYPTCNRPANTATAVSGTVVDLLPWAPPDGVELLIRWLLPLGETRAERPTGAVLPYHMVTRLPSGADALTDRGLYSVHTFALTKEDAQAESALAQRRILLLVGQGADDVVIVEEPAERQWVADNSIYRYVGTYAVNLRLQAANATTPSHA